MGLDTSGRRQYKKDYVYIVFLFYLTFLKFFAILIIVKRKEDFKVALLNEKNSTTEKIVHIMITDKCNRKYPYCCNNQYDISSIPVVTDEELRRAEYIYLTGGEPFAYSDPCRVANGIKILYPNIKKIGVYTKAYELFEYLCRKGNFLYGVDTLTISLKDLRDKKVFKDYLSNNHDILYLYDGAPHRVYSFVGLEGLEKRPEFDIQERQWQKNFEAAPDSIFRRSASWIE